MPGYDTNTNLIAPARIPVPSRRKAMDWSLALASQGIEAIIDYAPESTGWQLLVPEHEFERAREIIRQYQIENRGWPWHRPIFAEELRFDWNSIVWVGLLVLFFWLDTRFDLHRGGVMDAALVRHGQWWRLFTAIWLHADISHLASNAALGFVLLGLVMARYGTMPGLLVACLTGAGGNLLEALITSHPYRSLGASGVVMGCVGLLALPSRLRLKTGQRIPSAQLRTQSPTHSAPVALRYIFSGFFAAVMLFVLLALGPGTDVLAHLGGFLCGIIIAGLVVNLSKLREKPSLHILSGVVLALSIIVPWWLALHQ